MVGAKVPLLLLARALIVVAQLLLWVRGTGMGAKSGLPSVVGSTMGGAEVATTVSSCSFGSA